MGRGADSGRARLRARLRLLLRVAVTAGLLWLLLRATDVRQIGQVLAGAQRGWLAAGVLVMALSTLCAAWRWHVLLGGSEVRVPYLAVARITLVASFFSMFLPSSIGGDVMKVVLLAPAVERREAVLTSVLMDRVVGLAVTIGVGIVAVAALPSIWSNTALVGALGLMAVACAAGVAALFSRRLATLAGRLAPAWLARRLGPTAGRVRDSLDLLRGRPRVLGSAAALSVLRQALVCLLAYCGGLAFGIKAGLPLYFAVMPLSTAITTLPISINGLGVQDNLLVVFLGAAGVGVAQALSLSLYLHLLNNGFGLLGGAVFALTRGYRAAAGLPAPAAGRAEP